MGQIQIPAKGRMWRKRSLWLAEEYPDEYRHTDLAQEDSDPVNATRLDALPVPLNEEELMDIGERALGSSDQVDPVPEDSIDVGAALDIRQPGHAATEGKYANRGSILCERITVVRPIERVDLPFLTIPDVGPMIADGFHFAFPCQSQKPESPIDSRRSKSPGISTKTSWVDSTCRGYLAESHSNYCRRETAIEREITDLLLAKPNEPLAMIVVHLGDSRYASVPRVQSSLVVKRKGIDSYKGRLCAR